MEFIAQFNTGSFTLRQVKSAAKARESLERLYARIRFTRLIFGWFPDEEINSEVVKFCKNNGIKSYYWTPVFADRDSCEKPMPCVSIVSEGNESDSISNVCEGENFSFICPGTYENIPQIDSHGADGVFLDRIRYASAANSFESLFGCWCPKCVMKYEEAGIDVQRVRHMAKQGSRLEFIPKAYENGIYEFQDPDIDKLFAVKRNTITTAVSSIIDYAHSKGLEVGLDLFAPAISDFTGQDGAVLSTKADFIKPMLYHITNAPAGLPFEFKALGSEISNKIAVLTGARNTSVEQSINTLKVFENSKAKLFPGLDVNTVLPICNPSPQYVAKSISAIRNLGSEGVVLSWNTSKISDSVFDVLI